MGAAESVVRNVDKRTARREHRETFIDAIHTFADRFDYRARDGALADDASDRPIRVCVRKRPMFDHEWKKEKEFDVVTAGQDRVVVHDARMAKDMRKMFIDQNEMNFDRVFGEVAEESFETLTKINEAYCDDKNRPYQDVRIRHTIVLDDPFPDPDGLAPRVPERSPEPTAEQLATVRIADDENKHVCELQVVHLQLMVARKQLGGHAICECPLLSPIHRS